MGILDLLNRYTSIAPGSAVPDAQDHFQQVARESSPDEVADGLSQAFRSEQTPPFENMVGQLFGHSDPQQRAGMLGELMRNLSPAILGSLGSGPLGSILRGRTNGQVSPEEAAKVDPQDVTDLAREANNHNPSIVDRLSRFYADHPQLVATLGSVAMSLAMQRMASRRSV